jgi:hypothetical protein
MQPIPRSFAGRRVVVVGAGKSALVLRAPHWMLPRYWPGRIPSDRLLITRLTEAFLRYHHLSGFERFLHGPAKNLTRLFWRVMSRLIRLLLRTPAVMVPDEPLPAGIENVGVAPEFYEMARAGHLLMRRDADAAVADATGWQQSLPFLAPELQSAVLRDGHFQLYRHILPPTEPRLGIVGYASSVACQLTSEISAHWLSQSFRGDLTLPTVDEMHTEPTERSVLGGMIGLGGAEFRLPCSPDCFSFLALQAVILNKAMNLIVVITALPARLAFRPVRRSRTTLVDRRGPAHRQSAGRMGRGHLGDEHALGGRCTKRWRRCWY